MAGAVGAICCRNVLDAISWSYTQVMLACSPCEVCATRGCHLCAGVRNFVYHSDYGNVSKWIIIVVVVVST
eukprot:scaffold223227_cov19-Prasinocladus_malaysianus.AAC.2